MCSCSLLINKTLWSASQKFVIAIIFNPHIYEASSGIYAHFSKDAIAADTHVSG